MRNPYSSTLKKITVTILFTLLTVLLIQTTANAQTVTVVKAVPSTSSPHLGETFNVDITITDVQNLYGIDVTLRWNASVLQLAGNNSHLGVESNTGGVLHAEVVIVEETASQAVGTYHIVALSIPPASPFSGSGNIATLTFAVTSVGRSDLDLETELSDYNPGGTSNLIPHTDSDGSVDTVPSDSSNPAPLPWALYAIPLIVFLIIALIALILYRKRTKKNLETPQP